MQYLLIYQQPALQLGGLAFGKQVGQQPKCVGLGSGGGGALAGQVEAEDHTRPEARQAQYLRAPLQLGVFDGRLPGRQATGGDGSEMSRHQFLQSLQIDIAGD
ncbi:hypothetical protein D3C81_1268910 [compost metagenome]